MEGVKKVKTRRVFDDDFKTEIVKMRGAAQLNSGKNIPELSKSFDNAENEKLRKDVARLQDERNILKKCRQAFL